MYNFVKTNLFLILVTFFVSSACSDSSIKAEPEKLVTASQAIFSKILPRELQEKIISYLGFWECKNTVNDTKPINDLAFSNDGKYLAYASGNNLKIVDIATNKIEIEDGYHDLCNKHIFTVVFSSDDQILVVGHNDGDIRLFNRCAGNFGSNLIGHNKAIICLAYSNNGKLLASGSKDGTIKLWDIVEARNKKFGENSECLYTINGHTSSIKILNFSNDNLHLASAALKDKTVRLWEINSQKLIQTLDHDHPVLSLAYSDNGKLTTSSGSSDFRQYFMNIWDTKTSEILNQIREEAIDAKDNYKIVHFSDAYSNNGKYLACIGTRNIRVHNVNTKTFIQEISFENIVHSVKAIFSKDSKYIAVAAVSYAAADNENDNFIIKIWAHEDPDLTTLVKVSEDYSSTEDSSNNN